MKRYIITQPKEQGIYSQGDSVYTQIYIKNILTSAMVDPSSVSISIYDPCGVALVSNDSMPTTGVGIYNYDFSLSSTATFGIYSIKIETSTYDSLSFFNFVVFPWDVLSRIRELSGAFQQSDMSDYKLAMIAWYAYLETLGEIYELHTNEQPLCDPDTGLYFDGTNKNFQVRNYPIADSNGDTAVTGFGELTCGEDVTFAYIDDTGTRVVGKATVTDGNNGIVELTQISGAAVPSTIKAAMVTYSHQSETYNQALMREAVAYLAAHKALIAFKSLDKATLADLQSNRATETQRFLKRYEDLIEQIGFPMIGSGR